MRKTGNTAFGMDEQNSTNPPRRYLWPRFVFGGVALGIVLGIIWMSVLVSRIRNQREFLQWPTTAQPAVPAANATPSSAITNSEQVKLLADYQDTLIGGNAEAGRKVFFELPAASCGKCHQAEGQGGTNGPALDGIGTRQSREFVLESILFPNAVINTNFQTVVVLLKENRGVSGTLHSETETNLVLTTPDEGAVAVEKSQIVRRWIGVSPMPEGLWQQLTKEQLRDLIEFVATLKPR